MSSNAEGGVDGSEAAAFDLKKKKKDDRMAKILNELIQSERSYVKDLEIMLQLYVEPVRNPKEAEEDMSDIMTPQELVGVFSNVDQVLGINKALLQALDAAPTSLDNAISALKAMAPSLKVYSVFCSNQDTSLKICCDLQKKRPKFDAWLKDNQSKFLSRNLDLQSFLVKPVQRVCKYPLFLREMIDNSTNPDATAALEDVSGRIGAVVTHINEQRRLRQGLDGVIEVFQQLATDFPLVTGRRVLVFKASGGPIDEIPLPDKSMQQSPMVPPAHSDSPSSSSQPGSPRDKKKDSFFSKVATRVGFGESSSPTVTRRRSSTIGSSSTPPSLRGSGIIAPLLAKSGPREAHIFLFNDLFLLCTPCHQLGKKGLLDIIAHAPARVVRASPRSNDPTQFKLRILRDGAAGVTNSFLFKCKSPFELKEYMDAFQAMNPFHPRKVDPNFDPVNFAVAEELSSLRTKADQFKEQLKMLTERAQVTQLKKQRLDQKSQGTSSRAEVEDARDKMKVMFLSLPQYIVQAKELKPYLESFLAWIDVVEPLARTASLEVGDEKGPATAPVKTVSIRQAQREAEARNHQIEQDKLLDTLQKVALDLQAREPLDEDAPPQPPPRGDNDDAPPLPPRDEEDEWEYASAGASQQTSPRAAGQGETVKKKGKWVKKKVKKGVRRTSASVVQLDDLSGSGDPVASPQSSSKKPGSRRASRSLSRAADEIRSEASSPVAGSPPVILVVPDDQEQPSEAPPPPPPAAPRWLDRSGEVRELRQELAPNLAQLQTLIAEYRILKKMLRTKCEALDQVIAAMAVIK